MKEDPILQALRLPSGAHFHRCALQVNPHHYASIYRGAPLKDDVMSYTRELVKKAAELEISVLAVTDHNNVDGIDPIRQEAVDYGIHVFPGFEISSSEGIHVLCLYPPETEGAQLGRFLGEFGIRTTGPSTVLASWSFVQILQCVRDQGGIAIAAHVTNENGLFRVLTGEPRIRAWQDENLLAIQIPGAVKDLPDEIRPIVENRDPNYRRARPAGENLAVAVINARDVTKPEDLEHPSATCWIKMSEVSIEGLRQAFLDPESRIRLAGETSSERHTELVAMAWESGFLDGAAIHFNENLNVLIGGRGTGKSTVIESIRCVLGLDPLGEDARKTHEGIVRNVLRSGTKITLLVRSPYPAEKEYLIERTIPNPPVVRDREGNLLDLSPGEIIPRVEVYGQHEISELTKSPEKLTRLLERFMERDPDLARRKIEIRRGLERSRKELLRVEEDLKEVNESLAALPGLEETLRRFQEAGLEERLKEQSLLVREEGVLKVSADRLKPYRGLLEDLRRVLPIDRAFVSPKALEELPGKEILAELDGVLFELERELMDIAKRLEKALDSAADGLATVRSRWEGRAKDVRAEYERILRELQKSKVDGEEFIRLRRQIEELRPLRERLPNLQELKRRHEEERRSLLVEWEDVKAEEFRELERAARKVSRKLAGRVRVQVRFAGNRIPLFDFLRNEIGGRLSETIERLYAQEDLSLKELAEICRAGPDALTEKYGIPSTQAERIAQLTPEAIMRLEELDLPPTTQIELNLAPEGQPEQWQRLEELSTGQKATAVLLLLLLESDAPLVIDQPEDDLDNRFITEGVVPKMREEKRRRQFVFATHNANIPVLGDAELIVGLAASGEAVTAGKARIPQEHLGSIDARPVRELVEEVLEGGRAAFEVRRLKYGF